MSNNRTPSPTFFDQVDTLELLVWLALERRDLPVPHLSLSNYSEPLVHLTLDLVDFEAWRAALGLDSAAVELRPSGSESYLRTEGTFTRPLGGRETSFRVEIAAWGLPLLAERPAVEAVALLEQLAMAPVCTLGGAA